MRSKRSRSLAERFATKFEVAPSGCWPWRAGKNRRGYGLIQTGNHSKPRASLAHRVAWTLFRGRIVKDCVLHSCDNPACVNPGHLFLGTHADNMRDMTAKGRHPSHVHPGLRPRGSAHPLAKLDESRVSRIRELLSSGVAVRALARSYGVDRMAIKSIRDHRTWRHV